jgi:hypothetical protein
VKRIGLILMRSAFVAAIAFVGFWWSLATPWMSDRRETWISTCIDKAGGPNPYYCFDCDPHGCEAQFAGWFNTLPISTILALMTAGILLFVVGALSARRRNRLREQL